MPLGMLARSVARIIEHRRRRRRAAEGTIVADIDPTSPDVGLSLGEHRHGGVVAVQALGGEDMGLQPIEDRAQHADAGADLVGERRQAQRHAFPGVTLGLAVQRLMLAELLEHDHRQQAGTGPAPRNDVERRRRLIDALAVAARELLAHMLDDLPLARDHLQRLGDILAELGQSRSAAAGASGRRRDDHPLARQMLGKRLARGTLAGEGGDVRRSGLRARHARRRARPRWPSSPVPRVATPSDREDAPCVPSAARKAHAASSRSEASDARSAPDRRRAWPCATAASASAKIRRSRSTTSAAFSASISSGRSGQLGVHDPNRSTKSAICGAPISPVIQNVAGLPGCVRPMRPAWIAPIDRIEQITELRSGDRQRRRPPGSAR